MQPSTPGPLFIFADGAPLSCGMLVAALTEALTLAGFDSSQYSGHSFHIGAATAAARVGLSDSLIQMLGRLAFTAYIRTSKESLCAASVSLAS